MTDDRSFVFGDDGILDTSPLFANVDFFNEQRDVIFGNARPGEQYVVIWDGCRFQFARDREEAAAIWDPLPSGAIVKELPAQPVTNDGRVTRLKRIETRTREITDTIQKIEDPTIKSHLPTSLLSALSNTNACLQDSEARLFDLLDALGWPEGSGRDSYGDDQRGEQTNAVGFARENTEMSWVLMGLINDLEVVLGDWIDIMDVEGP